MLSPLGLSEQNKGPEIKAAIALLQEALSRADIPLRRRRCARGARPHHVMPPQFEDCIVRLQSAGYVAILTHSLLD
jgi:hypothetical protein